MFVEKLYWSLKCLFLGTSLCKKYSFFKDVISNANTFTYHSICSSINVITNKTFV